MAPPGPAPPPPAPTPSCSTRSASGSTTSNLADLGYQGEANPLRIPVKKNKNIDHGVWARLGSNPSGATRRGHAALRLAVAADQRPIELCGPCCGGAGHRRAATEDHPRDQD